MMTKKTSSVMFTFLLFAVLYLFMKITNMKLDFSGAGFRTQMTPNDEYNRCLAKFQVSGESNSQNKLRDVCGDVDKQSIYKRVFRWPKIYFSKPK